MLMASASPVDSAPAIGIDLGTTYSCVGVFRNGTVEILANDQGSRTTPSYVAFAEGERFIGEAAKSQEATNPANTVFDAKRLIGRLFDDDSVQSDMEHWPFEVVQEEGKPRIKVEHKGESKTFYPEQISAMVLAKMKKVAEDYLGQAVTKAVVTVPAHFNNSQRQATKDAATIAGLDVLRLISEPTSAALAYGFIRNRDRQWSEKRWLLVFDLGGGTLDVSVVNIDEDAVEVVTTAGDTHLGGEDFDNRMVDHFAEEFHRKHKKDMRASKSALSHLRAACEMAKRALSWNNLANIDIPYLFEGVHFHSTISGARFNDLNADLFRSSMKLVDKALRDAKMGRSAVDDVVLVGGSSRILKIQTLLKEFFDRTELCKDINPDEAVAYGAAVQAAILNGNQFHHVREFMLQDVTPLSLGVDVINPMNEVIKNESVMEVIIKRNTAIPTRGNKLFTTVSDNQTLINFKVYEGEHIFTEDNNLLGQFKLDGIQIAEKEVPEIDVTFDIDSDGILTVSAVDRNTGAKNQLTITNDKSQLSEEEIRRMVRDAEKFKEDDEEQRGRIAAKIALEDCALRFRTKVESDKAKGKVSESYRNKVLDIVNDTLDWSDRNKQGEIYEFENMQRELSRILQLGENDGFEDMQTELTRILQLEENDRFEDKQKG